MTKIPPGYLAKVLHALGRAGIVSAQRGLSGGFVLLRRPASLSLLDVVRVADPSRRVTTCPLGIRGSNLCPLHRQLDRAAALAERVLASQTIAQLMSMPDFPPPGNPAPLPCTSCPEGAVPPNPETCHA